MNFRMLYNNTMLRTSLFICFLFFIDIALVQAEVITNFSAEYTIKKDSVVEVTETINYDFEVLDKHGIFRTLEKKHPQAPTSWYKTRYVDIKVLSVSMDEKYQPFTVNDSQSELEIKIGDPDTIVTGSHVYKITYELMGALSYGDQGAEFYWNVTGNDWLVPISNATAVVRGEEADILSGENACYQGYFGSTASCSNLDKIGNVVMFTANNLNVGEGLTIATKIDSNAIAFVKTERISYLLFGFLLFTLWLIFAGYKTYRFR